MKNIALVGSGYWGKNIARNLAALGVLNCIVDINPATATLAKELGCNYVSDLSQALADNSIKGVAIATPAVTHFDIAMAAMAASKDVYVEKPISLSIVEGETMSAKAREKGLVLMVGHLLQYHAGFMALRALVASGSLGKPLHITCSRMNFGLLRKEENVMWSFSPHDISMLLALAGGPPEHVRAVGVVHLQKGIPDLVTVHARFASGLTADVRSSWYSPRKEQCLTVACENGMAVFDDTKPWPEKIAVYKHAVDRSGAAPRAVPAAVSYLEVTPSEPLRDELAHFVSCIETRQRPRTDAEEALNVLKVLQAAQASLDADGERVVLGAPTGNNGPKHPGGRAPMVHETAVVDAGVELGAGTKVWHFSHILSGSKIGENCNFGQNVLVGPDVVVGAGCKVQNNVAIYKGVELAEDVFCGPSMVFTNVLTPRAHVNRSNEFLRTPIGKGATLGANCTIVCGHSVGPYAMVGAGAVVTKDVAAHALVIGNPARRVGWVCSCGERLGKDLVCSRCGESFTETAQGLQKHTA